MGKQDFRLGILAIHRSYRLSEMGHPFSTWLIFFERIYKRHVSEIFFLSFSNYVFSSPATCIDPEQSYYMTQVKYTSISIHTDKSIKTSSFLRFGLWNMPMLSNYNGKRNVIVGRALSQDASSLLYRYSKTSGQGPQRLLFFYNIRRSPFQNREHQLLC